MSIADPRQLNEYYNDAFRSGDLERLVALYEPDAVLCPAPGQLVRGREEIRQRLRGLLALNGTLTSSGQSCVEFENLALLHAHWHFSGTGSDGRPIEIGGISSKLARRGSDGAWLYAMDLPLGGNPQGA